MKPIYVVSGYMRTGTSMMMRGCIEGGLEPLYSPKRDEVLRGQTADDWYTLQGGASVYEPDMQQMTELARTPEIHGGKVVKVMFGGLPMLAEHAYHYVFMRRDPEEIRQSYEGAFVRSRLGWLMEPGSYERHMRVAVCGIEDRADTLSLTELEYRDVLDDPLAAFRRLRDAGWPIDVAQAAAVVDPEMCRYRLETLEVGL